MRSLAALLLSLVVTACGDSGEEATTPETLTGSAPIQGRAGLYTLLTFPDQLEVAEGEEPVQNLMRVQKTSGEMGSLPAVMVTPPSVLRYEIPEADPRARLDIALGIHFTGYLGKEGSVTFKGSLNGDVLFEETLPCTNLVPKEERQWRYLDVPIGKGNLELTATYDGPREVPPRVGFANLRVFLPFEKERTTASVEHPNVLLICIDTLRADRLESYGGPAGTSPVMDQLAREGMRFDYAYACASWTIPGTASVLTGKSPPEHGLGASPSYFLPESIDTLPEVFQREGFRTGGFTSNPLIAPNRNFAQGFEDFQNWSWEHSTEILGDMTGWLEEHHQERFFLYAHFIDPHYPYEPTEESMKLFDPKAPEGYVQMKPKISMGRYYNDPDMDRDWIEEFTAHQLALYDAEVWDSDRAVKTLLDKLEELGLRENTVVCVTSDHGEEFLEHGWAGHNNQLFDESTRVPLVLAGPGVPQGRVIETPIENRYLAPTLLRLAGIEGGIHGPDLTRDEDLELLATRGVYMTTNKGTWADLDSRTTLELGNHHSLIDEGWRLMICRRVTGQEEPLTKLFDLSTDPQCLNDVSAEHPKRVKAMTKKINQWMEEGRATRPVMMAPSDATLELLEAIGYIGDGEDD